MPLVTLGDRACHYRLDGDERQPALVLSHSLGLDHGMWDEQIADFSRHFLVLSYDTLGHGVSAAPPGDYSIEGLSQDVLALTAALGIERFSFCGVSLGGQIGQWLGAHAGARLHCLILANTSPRIADPPGMEARRKLVLEKGMAAILDTAMARFFSAKTLARRPPAVAAARRTLLATNAVGYAGCCAALRDADLASLLGQITVPTLVISGDQDAAMPWPSHGDVLARGIAGARAIRLDTAHLSNLEAPRAFSAAVLEFLLESADSAYDRGMAVRRAVLADAHVDRAVAGTTTFTRAFQELITTAAWGTVWSRPGLDHRTRRMLVLAITAALGRHEEFRLHIRTGLASGLEACDIDEVLLMVAIYAGVPAANTAYHLARDEGADPS